jgi:hypothetical protein
MEVGGEAHEPSARSLLEAIKRLLKLANMSGASFIHKANWFSTVNSFRKIIMQERILHVQLMKMRRPRGCNVENHMHCSRFHHWTECFAIINSLLSETSENPMSFIMTI